MKTTNSKKCRTRGRRSGWSASAFTRQVVACPTCAAHVIPVSRETDGKRTAFVLPVHDYEISDTETLIALLREYESLSAEFPACLSAAQYVREKLSERGVSI